MKFLFPGFFIGGGALGVISCISDGETGGALFFLFWEIFICVLWFLPDSSTWFKSVHIDDKNLYISNYLKRIVMPLSDVVQIETQRMRNIGKVCSIYLKCNSAFGKKVKFMPTSDNTLPENAIGTADDLVNKISGW